MAPKSLITKKIRSLSFIIADTPKANKVVCTRQPETKPPTVAKPYFFPFTTLCMSTYMLSGPGAMAKAADAIMNAERIS